MNALTSPVLSSPASAACCGGWKRRFAQPSGRLGKFAGRLMAVKNAPMNRFAIGMLAPRPTDDVLEIGFGPGRSLQEIARSVPGGFVAGVDPSVAMLELAAARNRAAVVSGRLRLVEGGVSRLPFPDGRFDKVLAVNVVQFWPRPEADLREVRRVLRDGGRLVLGLRMREPKRAWDPTPGFSQADIETIRMRVEAAGFGRLRLEKRRLGRDVVCLIAER